MSADNNFFLQLFASSPVVQECANFDEETYAYIKSSHPAVAKFLEASKEIVAAAEVWGNVPKPGRPWNIVRAVEVGYNE